MQRTFFEAGNHGEWKIESITAIKGDSLPPAPRLRILGVDNAAASILTQEAEQGVNGCVWQLNGIPSSLRYATRTEVEQLRSKQEGLGRPTATCAALIPIKKSAAWWALAQDERRSIFEETSHHNKIGMEYLPAVARKLYHCRDLGGKYDFLTYFEFASEDTAAFDMLVARLRETKEWTFVEAEVDIRLSRDA
mmetsp:Transcript_6803/g.11681  ORF Transcript_6803/g.11681 Transcript_6803/m.11681 type:complete len:193 (-) Transcript_6803:647-1225(-)|eukprot:CAMPEP_0196657132 /NCGR_PEP_ID=MMETSP1086-20130531/21997_1 /TAXON_ID=77921 /ORGANISM="Cyanoptyche  gloeocystis , Strain SAG4.97" /LENGTH=192 /DNA_ID=CAMNT_0041990157 /DNA_START=183 /DNA_END=761 /DNA_ORIENTATION=+